MDSLPPGHATSDQVINDKGSGPEANGLWRVDWLGTWATIGYQATPFIGKAPGGRTVGSLSMWLAFLAACIVGLALQPILIPWLRRRGVMDVPNERSSHASVTPRGGGIAVLTAIGAGLLVGHPGGDDVFVVFVGAIALGVVGLTDDFRGLSAKLRLVVIILTGALGGLCLPSQLTLALTVPALALWVAAYVNAFNFMDGINGISGMTAIVAGVSYTLMGIQFGSHPAVLIGAALSGAALSFLPYNVPSAQVFLGDVGSYSLGFLIATLGWIVWAADTPLLLALAPTTVYLADTGSTLVLRHRRGAGLAEAHREHVYQRLVASGRSHLSVALTVAGLQAAIVAVIWWGTAVDRTVVGVAVALAVLVAYVASPSLKRVSGVTP